MLMANIKSVPRTICTGCGACEIVCPAKCITMISDEEGFLIPNLDESHCVHCSRCMTVCPTNPGLLQEECISAVAFRSLIPESKASSSGGAAYALSSQVLKSGGAVIACIFDNKGVASHQAIENLVDLRASQGSKYVQSDAREGFKQCERLLASGKTVLFIGTPCQVSAVKKLTGETKMLLTCDLICHGVPSPKFWLNTLEYYNAKGCLLERANVMFRSSDRRSRVNFELYCRGDINSRIPAERDPYFSLFLNGASMRESCYSCPYAQRLRVGDITIGDCSSKERCLDFHPNQAISTILVHTEAGKRLLDDVLSAGESDSTPLDVEAETRLNQQLRMPIVRPTKRNDVYRDLKYMAYDTFSRYYCKPVSFKWHAKQLIKHIIPVHTRTIIKQVLHIR